MMASIFANPIVSLSNSSVAEIPGDVFGTDFAKKLFIDIK
jgi:hypothetical protein